MQMYEVPTDIFFFIPDRVGADSTNYLGCCMSRYLERTSLWEDSLPVELEFLGVLERNGLVLHLWHDMLSCVFPHDDYIFFVFAI